MNWFQKWYSEISSEVVKISKEIHIPLNPVFDCFYHWENFSKSSVVSKFDWVSKSKWTRGSKRDMIMIVGCYFEEISQVEEACLIRYWVNSSFPAVQQDFTELFFKKLSKFDKSNPDHRNYSS